MTTSYEEVSFKTLDGVILRGRLYAASRRGPAVIITPAWNCTSDEFYPGVCEAFAKAGISALIYDPRNTGISGGFPRNDIDPIRQVEDYSDAFIYLTTLPIVDPAAIVFWGCSFSGALVIAAAAVDKRAAAVIAVGPILKYSYVSDDYVKSLESKMFRDRENQILHGHPPFFVETTETKKIPANSHVAADQKSADPTLTHNKGATIQSFHRSILWQPVPVGLLPRINPTPIMFLTPEHDTVSPTQHQIEIFEKLDGPKKFHLAEGKGHVNVLIGDDVPMLVKIQSNFIWQVVRGRYKQGEKTNGTAS